MAKYNSVPGVFAGLTELERRVQTLETTPRSLDTGQVTVAAVDATAAGFIFDPAWTLTGSVMYQRIGPQVQVYITSFSRAGADITVPTTGDIVNNSVFTLPPSLSPYPTQTMGYNAGVGRLASYSVAASASGSLVQLTSVGGGGANIVTGELLSFFGTWFTSNAPNV